MHQAVTWIRRARPANTSSALKSGEDMCEDAEADVTAIHLGMSIISGDPEVGAERDVRAFAAVLVDHHGGA